MLHSLMQQYYFNSSRNNQHWCVNYAVLFQKQKNASYTGARVQIEKCEPSQILFSLEKGGGGVPGVPDRVESTAAAAATVVCATLWSGSSLAERVTILK